MIKRDLCIYCLIVLFGIIIFLSFFQFNLGSFDWPFFAVMMVYLVISSVLEPYIVNAVISVNPAVCSARIRRNEVYTQIEKEQKWNDYKALCVEERTINNFHKAYCCYAFKSDSVCHERLGAVLSKSDFKRAYLAKRLKEMTKGEKISFVRRLKMLYFEKTQDSVSFIDKIHLKYLRGDFLGKTGKDYAKIIVSILLNAFSIILAICSVHHFSFDGVFTYKLLILIVMFAGDIFLIVSNVKEGIECEKDLAKNAEDIMKILFNNEKSGIENTLEYIEFQNC